MAVKYLRLALSKKLKVSCKHKVNFIPKTSTKISVVEISNKVKGCKVSHIPESSAKVEGKRF